MSEANELNRPLPITVSEVGVISQAMIELRNILSEDETLNGVGGELNDAGMKLLEAFVKTLKGVERAYKTIDATLMEVMERDLRARGFGKMIDDLNESDDERKTIDRYLRELGEESAS